jgi:hypothetical protein
VNGSFRGCAIASRVGSAACEGGMGVSGNDLHPVSDDEAKRLERAGGELILDRLQN